MKVKELVKKLLSLDQEMEVILSSDEEGNSYRKLYVVSDLDDNDYWDSKEREIVTIDEPLNNSKRCLKVVVLS